MQESGTKISPLASVSATRAVLEAHGLATKKALGQNFLVEDGVLRRIIKLSGVTADDVVLEVGPGIGTLTIALLKSAQHVISVERDTDLPRVLESTCHEWDQSFTLLQKDALELRLDDLNDCVQEARCPLPVRFIANLPYAVAATLVLDYFERFTCLQSATVMVQAEVADRMRAHPGSKNYGAYTVKLSLYAQPAGCFSVAPGNFYPPPRVNSTVLRLDRIAEDGLTPSQRRATAIMADAAFANRRKTMANSCKSYFKAAKDDDGAQRVVQVFADAGIDAGRRGESLCVDEFKQLGCAYDALRGGK